VEPPGFKDYAGGSNAFFFTIWYYQFYETMDIWRLLD